MRPRKAEETPRYNSGCWGLTEDAEKPSEVPLYHVPPGGRHLHILDGGIFFLLLAILLSLFCYYFLTVLDLLAAHGLSLLSGSEGYFVVVCGLFIAVASCCRAQTLGLWASVTAVCGLCS